MAKEDSVKSFSTDSVKIEEDSVHSVEVDELELRRSKRCKRSVDTVVVKTELLEWLGEENYEKITITVISEEDTREIEIMKDATVLKLRKEVCKAFKIPFENISLIFSGQALKDDETLSNRNVQDEDVVHLVNPNPKCLKNRRTSQIWHHFAKIGDKGKCNYCKAVLSCTYGTSNLRRHIIIKHRNIPLYNRTMSLEEEDFIERSVANVVTSTVSNQSCSDSLQPTAMNSSPEPFEVVANPLSASRSKIIDLQLVKMITKEYYSVSIVEDREFQVFVKMLCPNYILPSCKEVSNSLLPSAYNDLWEKLKVELTQTKAISLTADRWMNINKKSFCALTAHFINEKSTLKSCLLECSEFEEDHTGANISDWITSVLKKIEIEDKIIALVTDNAAHMKLASTLLGFPNLPCFAHCLNLVIQESIKLSIQRVVDVVNSTVLCFKKSPFLAQKLLDSQKSLEKEHLKLKQDTPTRWNSTYDMLQRFLHNKDPIKSCIGYIERSVVIEERDWIIMEESLKVLEVFYHVTKEISYEKSLSISKIGVMILLIQQKLADIDGQGLQTESGNLLKNLIHEFDRKFQPVVSHDLIQEAMFYDPRFKKQGFGTNELFQNCYDKVVEEMKRMYSLKEASSQSASSHRKPTSSLWDSFSKKVSNLPSSQPTAVLEVDKYLAEDHFSHDEDPLVWWNVKKQLYPTLYQLASRRLCIPATSVPCERIFTKAGQVYSERRNRLSSKKFNEIIFLNQNL